MLPVLLHTQLKGLLSGTWLKAKAVEIQIQSLHAAIYNHIHKQTAGIVVANNNFQ